MSTRRITKPSNRNKIKPVIPKEVAKELTKKRTIKETESTSNADPKESAPVDDEGDSEEEEYVDYVDDNQEDDVQVDFDVSIPDMEKDYYGLELYTKNFLVGQPYNYADLTQIVLGDEEKKEPNFLTSVIKVPYDDEKKPDAPKKKNKDNKSDEEELNWEWNDVYGFLSVVDMNKYKKSESVKQIKEYIMDKCKDKKMKDQLAEIFSGKVGLIVNERVMNLPFEVGAMLHENLHQEITEAVKEGECTFFKHYIILTKIFYPVSNLDNTQKKAKMMPVFTKGEEEFYYNRAELKFKYEISNPYTLDSKSVAIEYAVEHEGVVIVVERSKIEKIMKKIASAREDIQKKSN